jgi:ABC-type antimicrobial peptide transport system permease subunit
VSVSSVTAGYFAVRQWAAVSGRVITPEDARQAADVCVIGRSVRNALFPNDNPLDQEMRVHDVSCRVVGVLDAKGTSAFSQDQDDVIFMPFSTFSRRIMGNDRVGQIMAAAVSSDRIDAAKTKSRPSCVVDAVLSQAKKTILRYAIRGRFRRSSKPWRAC